MVAFKNGYSTGVCTLPNITTRASSVERMIWEKGLRPSMIVHVPPRSRVMLEATTLLYGEVEPPEPTVRRIRDPHHQTAIEQPVPTVQPIVRKIQLGGHDAPARFLNLDMIMTGPTVVS